MFSAQKFQTCLKAKFSGKNVFVIINPHSILGSILTKIDWGRSKQRFSSIETIEPISIFFHSNQLCHPE